MRLAVIRRVVADGQAPHYPELGAELGIDLSEAKDPVQELVAITPGWVHPDTDYYISWTRSENGAAAFGELRARLPRSTG